MFGREKTEKMKKPGVVEVKPIKIVWLSEYGKHAVILSEVLGDRYGFLILNEWEANAIGLFLEQRSQDPYKLPGLFSHLLDHLEVKIKSVVLRKLFDTELLAQVTFWNRLEKKTVTQYPGEAIELALRCNAPIYLDDTFFPDTRLSPAKSGLSEPEGELRGFYEKLERALELEDYETAAMLRDKILKHKRKVE